MNYTLSWFQKDDGEWTRHHVTSDNRATIEMVGRLVTQHVPHRPAMTQVEEGTPATAYDPTVNTMRDDDQTFQGKWEGDEQQAQRQEEEQETASLTQEQGEVREGPPRQQG